MDARLIEKIRIPEQKAGRLPLDLNPKALQEWREALPLANLQATVREVFGLLRDSNRLEIPLKQRLLLLDALRPQIEYISGALTKGCLGHAHPLPEKVIRLVQLNQELLSEAAIGRKIVARELLGKKLLFGSRERQLADALQSVLHYLGWIVLESYRTYVPFPEGLWGEIHAIHELARWRRLTHLKSDAFSDEGRLTIEDSYMRLVLLALASPYHIERSAIHKIYLRLAEWSSAAHLLPLRDGDSDEMHIVVRLGDQAPPCFHVLEDGEESVPGEVRVLDGSKLDAILEHEIERLQSGHLSPEQPETPRLPFEVLATLRDCWSGPTTRGESRYKGEVEVQVAIGLTAACYYLTHGHGSVDEMVESGPVLHAADAIEELSLEVDAPKADFDTGGMISSTEQKRDKIADMLLPQAAAAAWTERRSQEKPRSCTCRTVDFSASGCQLACAKESELTISVGDLLCVGFDDTSTGRWKVGTARWIRQRSGSETQVGVRILANEGRGVKAGVCDDTGYVGDLSDCILLPGRDQVTLLTPRMPFAAEKMIYMLDGEEEHYLRLKENLETSSRFARFNFRQCTEKELAKIEAERNRPVARLSKAQLEAMERGESIEKVLGENSGVWDGMRHDW